MTLWAQIRQTFRRYPKTVHAHDPHLRCNPRCVDYAEFKRRR